MSCGLIVVGEAVTLDWMGSVKADIVEDMVLRRARLEIDALRCFEREKWRLSFQESFKLLLISLSSKLELELELDLEFLFWSAVE